GSDEIVIQLAGIKDPAKAAQIIGSTGQLQFFDFETALVPPTVSNGTPTPVSSLYSLLTEVKADAKRGTEAYYLFGTKTTYRHVNGKLKKTVTKNAVLAGPFPRKRQLLA